MNWSGYMATYSHQIEHDIFDEDAVALTNAVSKLNEPGYVRFQAQIWCARSMT